MITLKLSDLGFGVPAGRYAVFGPQSGEAFRERHLRPAVIDHDEIRIDLDGSTGGTASWWDEALGALIRDGSISETDALTNIQVVTTNPNIRYIESLVKLTIWDAA